MKNVVNKRIRGILKEKDVSQTDFSKMLGIELTTVNAWLKENNPRQVPIKHLIKITEIWPEISFDYLRYGNSETNHSLVNEPNQEMYQSNEEHNGKIRYYDIEGSAGKIEMFDPGNGTSFKDIVIPGFGDCDIALNVWGDSMEPVLCNGCIAICKEASKQIIEYGYMYFIVTSHNNRMFKYIKKSSDPGKVTCASANNFYDPFDINIDDILKLYIVKGHIERNAV